MIKQLSIYRDGNAVKRMHARRTIGTQTNGEHSANAALIAYELCKLNGIDSAGCILYMLLHDISEGYTGDMPANVKWANKKLNREIKAIEKKWNAANIDLPDLSREEKAICHIADLAELGMYCIEQLDYGNKHVLIVLYSVINSIRTSSVHGIHGVQTLIDYFMVRGGDE